MHQLISQQLPLSDSPPQTADQVIEEIDQMLQVLFQYILFNPELLYTCISTGFFLYNWSKSYFNILIKKICSTVFNFIFPKVD